jgi:hypothetical protein
MISNKSILCLGIYFFIVLSNANSDNIENQVIPNDWKRNEIIVDGLTSFVIYLPGHYELRIGNRVITYHILHQIYLNNVRVGGISISSFSPDYLLWSIPENDIIDIPLLISNNIYHLKLFNNINQRRLDFIPIRHFNFEVCLINYLKNDDEKYLHMFGYTDDEKIKDDLIKAFSTIYYYE